MNKFQDFVAWTWKLNSQEWIAGSEPGEGCCSQHCSCIRSPRTGPWPSPCSKTGRCKMSRKARADENSILLKGIKLGTATGKSYSWCKGSPDQTATLDLGRARPAPLNKKRTGCWADKTEMPQGCYHGRLYTRWKNPSFITKGKFQLHVAPGRTLFSTITVRVSDLYPHFRNNETASSCFWSYHRMCSLNSVIGKSFASMPAVAGPPATGGPGCSWEAEPQRVFTLLHG